MSAIRIAFKVHGTVQGVGFRDFTQKRATEHGLKGWVKNTTCGRVEGEAQGDSESVQKLLKDIDRGPRLAHVVKLEKKDLTPQDGEDHFGVKRTSDSAFHSEP
ncbi:hypothetical protein ASPWEDRAFT_46221 [Aspergillus wentii DTO 134E9]|uniref:Acylphosphatase n=1 Tax=Aspergillus wentii DTO 134E9 TaxID=1073089 RepID=A0A1L9R6R9_ASPWE|nr:uncharacterized protein ASPWEDRAFT_46221 [Aspergillus wentii DTO 134E9]OJJ30610.1 hypothetical protein ASPWEDRAFT_46221 [Aspergillus wentii DTO 134E9]